MPNAGHVASAAAIGVQAPSAGHITLSRAKLLVVLGDRAHWRDRGTNAGHGDRSVPVATAFVDEVIDETIGTSRRERALMLVALVAGAVAAVRLTLLARSAEPAIARPEVETT